MKVICGLLLCFSLSFANDYQEAAKFYDVDSNLLEAIAKTESSENPNALNCANSNQSCDYGIMQINSVHLQYLKQYGISKELLFDKRIGIFIGAWHLKNCINKHGNSRSAINCYNGRVHNNDYYKKVLKNYTQKGKNSENT